MSTDNAWKVLEELMWKALLPASEQDPAPQLTIVEMDVEEGVEVQQSNDEKPKKIETLVFDSLDDEGKNPTEKLQEIQEKLLPENTNLGELTDEEASILVNVVKQVVNSTDRKTTAEDFYAIAHDIKNRRIHDEEKARLLHTLSQQEQGLDAVLHALYEIDAQSVTASLRKVVEYVDNNGVEPETLRSLIALLEGRELTQRELGSVKQANEILDTINGELNNEDTKEEDKKQIAKLLKSALNHGPVVYKRQIKTGGYKRQRNPVLGMQKLEASLAYIETKLEGKVAKAGGLQSLLKVGVGSYSSGKYVKDSTRERGEQAPDIKAALTAEEVLRELKKIANDIGKTKLPHDSPGSDELEINLPIPNWEERDRNNFLRLFKSLTNGVHRDVGVENLRSAINFLERRPKAQRANALKFLFKDNLSPEDIANQEKGHNMLLALSKIATQKLMPSPKELKTPDNTEPHILKDAAEEDENNVAVLLGQADTLFYMNKGTLASIVKEKDDRIALVGFLRTVLAPLKQEAKNVPDTLPADEEAKNAYALAVEEYNTSTLKAQLELQRSLLFLTEVEKQDPGSFREMLMALREDPTALEDDIDNSTRKEEGALRLPEKVRQTIEGIKANLNRLNSTTPSDQPDYVREADYVRLTPLEKRSKFNEELERNKKKAVTTLKAAQGTGSRFSSITKRPPGISNPFAGRGISNPFAKIPNPFKRKKNVQSEAGEGEEVETEKKPGFGARFASGISALRNKITNRTRNTEGNANNDGLEEERADEVVQRKEPANKMEERWRKMEEGWRNRQGSIGSVLLLLLGGAIAGAVVFALVANPFGMGLVGIGIGVVATGVAMGVLIRLTGFNVRTLLTPFNRLKSLKNFTELDIRKRVENSVINEYIKNHKNKFTEQREDNDYSRIKTIDDLINAISDEDEKRKCKWKFNKKYDQELRNQRFRRRAILALEVVGFIIAAVVVAMLFKELMASAALLFATEAVLAKVIVPAVVVGICGTGVCIDGCKEMYSWGLWSKLKSKMKSSQRAAGDENQNNRPKPTNLDDLAALNTNEITVDNLDLTGLKANPFTAGDVDNLRLNDPGKEAAIKGIIPALQNNTLALEVNQPAPEVERTENVLAKLSGSEAISNKIEDSTLTEKPVQGETNQLDDFEREFKRVAQESNMSEKALVEFLVKLAESYEAKESSVPVKHNVINTFTTTTQVAIKV